MFRLKMKPSCSISNSVDKFLSVRNDEIVFGFGSEQKDVVGWMRITRDVATDIDKVLSMKKSPHKYKKTSFSIFLLQLSCHGQVTNISLVGVEQCAKARLYLSWSGLSSPLETRSILLLLRGLWECSI